MRKLILWLAVSALLIAPAQAQRQQTSTADQGKPGAVPWPVSWTGQSVLADLRVAGNPVAAGNPVPVTVGNFPATQVVSGAVTANIGTTNGLALDSSLQTIKTTLGSPFQAGGSVGISGALPAFAAPPTVNLGTLNGAATFAAQGTGNASLASLDGKLGSLGQKASAGSAPVVLASDQPSVTTKIDQTTPGATNGVVINNGSLWYAPTLMTANLAASSTTYSGERDQGAAGPSPYSYYSALVNCDQTGTLKILAKTTPGSSTIAVAGTATITAGVPVSLSVRTLFRVFQVQYVNGTSPAANCTIVDGFTAN